MADQGAESLDEFCKAAQAEDLDTLRRICRQGLVQPASEKAQRAVLVAAGCNRVRSLRALLEWGAPAGAAERETGATALHAACLGNADQAVAHLCEKAADLGARDASGRTPLDCAVAGAAPKLDAVRELLRAGCEVSHELCRTVPGLAQVAREAQLDGQARRWKELAERRDVAQDLLGFDGDAVWRLQSEHMRLLSELQEQRAGRQMGEYELELAAARRARERSSSEAEELSGEAEEKRRALQDGQARLMELIREHSGAEQERQVAREAARRTDGELRERRAELDGLLAEKAAGERELQEQEQERREQQAAAKALEERVDGARSRCGAVRAQLKEKRGELRGWQRDQMAAQKLAQRANERLAGLMPREAPPASPTAAA